MLMCVILPLQLCTQIIETNANPEWNEVLNLQVKVVLHKIKAKYQKVTEKLMCLSFFLCVCL